METSLTPDDHVIVVFGATGDLARRELLPAFLNLEHAGLMPENYRVVGSARTQMSDDEFRAFARDAVQEFGRARLSDDSWRDFARKLSFVCHDFGSDEAEDLVSAVLNEEKEVGDHAGRLFYLAVPPDAFEPITKGLGTCGLAEGSRIVFEKPFGNDLESARHLDDVVHEIFDESQVYRIDHFLGKETVQNIWALRFANGMFEPVWNRRYIDHIQIDVPEELGIEERASFYDSTGAFKDMVVTHLLQVLSVIAMEPPTSLKPKALVEEMLKVLQAVVPLERGDVLRGQYVGYGDAEGIDAGSKTETFVAARVCIDNWRWAGVPFYLRTGKRMAETHAQATLAFRRPPQRMFKGIPETGFGHDHVTLELGPHEGVSLAFMAKEPGPDISLAPARMDFQYDDAFKAELVGPYDRLIHDALMGDPTLFIGDEAITRAWEIVDGVIADPPPLLFYEQGSWGPDEIEDFIAPRTWHLPTRS
jgi:glucose-6-phosphate 1-dehydrogenase